MKLNRKNRMLKASTLAAITMAVSSASSSYGQTAYFSLQGSFPALGDKHEFGINLSSGVTSAETFKFVTYTNLGGTNSAGDTIGFAGGIDSFLELVSVFGPSMGSNDDGGPGFDSLLSWPGVADSGGTLTSPIGSGPYTLKLNEFNNDATGAWAVDLIGPASKMSMNRITKTGTSTVSSFKFGTTGAGTNPAVFNYDGFTALNITGALTIAVTGKATFTHNSAGNQTTVSGITTVNTGGQLNITNGTFNANDNINVTGGIVSRSGGTLNLAAGKAITLTSAGQFTDTGTGSYNIGEGRSLNVYSGSSATVYGQLNIGTFIDTGTLIVDGASSLVTTNISGTGDSYWGVTNGSANVTISNSGTADINSPTLHLSDDGLPSSTSTVSVQTGGKLNIKNLRVGGGSAGTATLTVTGTGSVVTQAAGSTLVVGGTSTSIGTLNVDTSSTFNTSTGGITINPTGTINIGGGAFNANADVTLDGGKLLQTSGSFTLGASKNLTASNGAQVSFTDGFSLASGGTVTIQSGSSISSADYLGTGFFGNGSIVVTGAGSTLTSAGGGSSYGSNTYTGSLTVSNQAVANYNGNSLHVAAFDFMGSTGTLSINTGGDLNCKILYIANGSTGTGTVTVNGSGSTVTQAGDSTLTLGGTGVSTSVGTINVQSSGTFTTGTGAVTINKTGTVNITSGGSFTSNGNMTIDGGQLIQNGSTTSFTLAAGKTLTASNNALVQISNNETNISDGKTFTFNSGADLQTLLANAYIDVGDTTAGTLVVTGTGSTLSVFSQSYWGADGGTANVTISNGATATMTGGFELCQGPIPNTSGTLNILSSATLTSNHNVKIGNGGSNGGSGFLNVNGGTFSIVGATRTLTIGHATTGTAQLLVSGGGTFNTDGPTTINATGTLGNGFGTINAKAVTNNGNFNSSSTTNVTSLNGTGTLTVNSGTFSSTSGIIQNTATVTFGGTIDIAADGTSTGVSVLKNLSFGANGFVNLHNNDLIVDYTGGSSTYNTIYNKVKSGLVLLGGTNNGIGSTEVDAQTIPATILAVVDNGTIGGQITETSGVAVPADSVIVKYTWFGDSNLDGVVDGSDYALIDTGLGSNGTLGGWVFGDYDYSGTIDGSDYALIDTGLLSQSGALPEPTSMLGIAIMGYVLKRSRRQ